MSEITAIATFLSGIGLGGTITFLIKHSLEQKSKLKDVWLLDYKATCDGLLEAYKQVAISGSHAALKEFAFYQLKLQLYANDDVIKFASALKDSDPGSDDRDVAIEKLLRAMRLDLGLA